MQVELLRSAQTRKKKLRIYVHKTVIGDMVHPDTTMIVMPYLDSTRHRQPGAPRHQFNHYAIPRHKKLTPV